jgi:transposase
MEIITGVERRRRWHLQDKLRILAELDQPGASLSDVARRHELSRGLLQAWRRQFSDGALSRRAVSMFVPVQIAGGGNEAVPQPIEAPTPSVPARSAKRSGVMEIDVGGGRRIRVDRDVDVDALRRVLEALALR